MVKIEKIFPGGAASTCEVLKVSRSLIKHYHFSLLLWPHVPVLC